LKEEYQEINDQELTTIKEENENETEVLTLTVKPDPLRQLLQCLNRAATTAQVFSITEDVVYLSYSMIMSKVKFLLIITKENNYLLLFFFKELCY
jgi:hypothetical protein